MDGASIAEQDLVFAVSDGMGGGNAGDMASALILERMAKLIPETFKAAAKGFFPDSLAYLEQVLKDVHEHINEAALASEGCEGMAATLALAWFSPENLYLANVGDSRIYRCRDGRAEQLSKDHTSAWGQLARGEISEVEYRNHPRRSALYRVMGGGKPIGAPHFAAVQYQPGDRFLICSDGLIDGVWERHIRDALAENAPPVDCCEKLLERAVANAGTDDTTLIVIAIS
jgi:protein phosphatase